MCRFLSFLLLFLLVLFQSQGATSVIDRLITAAAKIAAVGTQLRSDVATAAASDDYGALDAAPRVGQLFVDMEAQLDALGQQAAAASGPGGCISGLRLEDSAKAAALSGLAQLGTVAQLHTKIALGQSAAVRPAVELAAGPSASFSPSPFPASAPVPAVVRPLQHLKSRVLPEESGATLLQFFGGIPVGHGKATAARPQRARGRRAVVSSRLMMRF